MLYRIDAWVCTPETKEHQACSKKAWRRGLVVQALHTRVMVAWKLFPRIRNWLVAAGRVAGCVLAPERHGQAETSAAINGVARAALMI